ncbi:MAG: Hsp20/alpha crystallin family protein [Bacteroidota bacterium]
MGYYHRRRRRAAHQHPGHGRGHRAHRRAKFNVPVNIIEYDDRFECHLYATGFSRDQISITISDDVIYVSGRREPEEDRPNFLLHEFPIRVFERSFELSEAVDQAAVSAKQENGVLIIHAPKIAEAQRPDIQIKVG